MYFDKHGKDNTDQTLKFAADRGRELGLTEAVVATSTGKTAYKAMEVFDGFQLTVVTYHCGFKEPFKNRMEEKVRQDIEDQGIRVIAASHALSGVERSVAQKHAGALSGNDIVSIGGSGSGADAALILKPAHQNNFFDMRIREVVCKPRNF